MISSLDTLQFLGVIEIIHLDKCCHSYSGSYLKIVILEKRVYYLNTFYFVSDFKLHGKLFS